MDSNFVRNYVKERVETAIGVLAIAVEEHVFRAETEFPEYLPRLECNREAIDKQIELLEELEYNIDQNDSHAILRSLNLLIKLNDFIHRDVMAISTEMSGGIPEGEVVH